MAIGAFLLKPCRYFGHRLFAICKPLHDLGNFARPKLAPRLLTHKGVKNNQSLFSKQNRFSAELEMRAERAVSPSAASPLRGAVALLAISFLLSACGGFSPSNSASPAATAATTGATPPPSSTPGTIIITIPAPPDPSGGVTAPPTTVTVSTVTAREMQPIELQFTNDFRIIDSTLPAGSLYDSSLHQFLWLTKKGQAGSYMVQFTASGNRTVQVPIVITAISQDMLAKGPTDGYQDGDVGYVFVHGAGSVDRCVDTQNLADYWKNSPNIIGRKTGLSTLACYDGRNGAEYVAQSVAKQILNADCGRFKKCVIITHSMGGLVMEHILTHVRAAQASDPEPVLFQNAQLYQSVKDKTLTVISLASAAGGSRVADIVHNPGNKVVLQTVIGTISQWLGSDDDSTESVQVGRASDILAPYGWDPGVPIYMVPGYTQKTVAEQDDDEIAAVFNDIVGNISLNVYQGDQSLATLETIVQFEGRSDGLIDFRSGCGIASDKPHDGPGYHASLAIQMQYCFSAPHKPSHYVWFLSNLNHYLISTDWNKCHNSKNPCTISDPDAAHGTFSQNSSYRYLSAVEAIRAKLDVNRQGNPAVVLNYR